MIQEIGCRVPELWRCIKLIQYSTPVVWGRIWRSSLFPARIWILQFRDFGNLQIWSWQGIQISTVGGVTSCAVKLITIDNCTTKNISKTIIVRRTQSCNETHAKRIIEIHYHPSIRAKSGSCEKTSTLFFERSLGWFFEPDWSARKKSANSTGCTRHYSCRFSGCEQSTR